MKKTYIEPKTSTFVVKCERLLGTLSSGDGRVQMSITNENASSEGESRRGGSSWDDED